jgi:SAM-dependent methyltransferase
VTSAVRKGRRVDAAPFSLADLELESTLDNLDEAENYSHWILEMVEPFLGDEVLEVGAGHGTFTALLAQQQVRVVATDLSERCVGVLQDRFVGVSNVEVVRGDIESVAERGPFNTAILINVLEHIEDDDSALRALSGSLKEGGRLILWVPAFEALYAEFDRKVGHFRRYEINGLTAQLSRAGFTIVEMRYANALGAMAWWVVARMLRGTPTQRTSVNLFDRYAVPVVKWLESRRPPPFGQSIFAVAAPSVQSDATPPRLPRQSGP